MLAWFGSEAGRFCGLDDVHVVAPANTCEMGGLDFGIARKRERALIRTALRLFI